MKNENQPTQEEIKAAKEVLQRAGYAVGSGCLWHVIDVQSKFNIDRDDAMSLMETALNLDGTMETINDCIWLMGDAEGLPEIDSIDENEYWEKEHSTL